MRGSTRWSRCRSHRWRTAANSAGYLLPHLRPQDRLLDVGVGPGTITVEFLPPIEPGMDRRAFMAELEQRIETATAALISESAGEPAGVLAT